MTLRQQLLHTARHGRTDRPFRRIEVGWIGQEDCLDQQQHRQGGDSIQDGRDQQLHSKVSVRRDKHSPAAATAFALHSKATRPTLLHTTMSNLLMLSGVVLLCSLLRHAPLFLSNVA